MRLSIAYMPPTDSSPSTTEQLLDQKAALLDYLAVTRQADQSLKKYMAKRSCFTLQYANGFDSTDWCPPPDIERYEGMMWQQNDRWSRFVLVHYKAPVEKEVPQAIPWEGVTSIVVIKGLLGSR
jgi:hypothetical protein